MAIHKIQIHKLSDRTEKIVKMITIVSGIIALLIWFFGYLEWYQLFVDKPLSNILSGFLLTTGSISIIGLSLIVQSYVVEKKNFSDGQLNKAYTNDPMEAFSLEGTIMSVGLYLAPFGLIAGVIFIITGLLKLLK